MRESARPFFLETGHSTPKNYSEETAREIDEEIRVIINEAYERAKHVLTEWREALDRAAKILLKREVLEGSELRKLIKELGDKDRAVA